MCLSCVGSSPHRSRLRLLISARLQQPELGSCLLLGKQQCQAVLRALAHTRGLAQTSSLLALEGAARTPLPPVAPLPHGLSGSQESYQPYEACSCQVEICACCPGKAQSEGRQPLLP